MKYRLIAAKKAQIPVARACRFLGVSASGYYAWACRGPSKWQREDMVLLAHIREAFRLSHGTYGSPRMTMKLQDLDQGLGAGRRRIARLMRENGLKGRQPRRYRRTTDSDHGFAVAPNLLERDFTASRANEKWVHNFARKGDPGSSAGTMGKAISLRVRSLGATGLRRSRNRLRPLTLLTPSCGGPAPTAERSARPADGTIQTKRQREQLDRNDPNQRGL